MRRAPVYAMAMALERGKNPHVLGGVEAASPNSLGVSPGRQTNEERGMYWIAVGDIHESTERLASIPGVREAAGLIITGDMTNRGGPEQAGRVLAVAQAVNPVVLAQVGNMDLPQVDAHLSALGLNMHRQARWLAPGLALMGVGFSSPTPFGTPCEAGEDELAAWLAEARRQALSLPGAAPGDALLAVIHTPPKNTRLDCLPGGMCVGSTAVREFIMAAQPDVCVCGHIHEAVGEERLGRSHVLNPGMLAEGGFVRLNFEGGRLTAVLGRA